MDTLDAITLLYLSKNWDGQGTLLDCAHTFQQTKEKLVKAMCDERGQELKESLENGTFSF